MFNFFKKEEVSVSKTGVYAVNGKKLTPLNELPKTGSYNEISENLGFQTFHGVITFDSKKIEFIAFKRRTKEPIFANVKDKTQSLSYSDIVKVIQEIDWGFEWRQLDFEDKNT